MRRLTPSSPFWILLAGYLLLTLLNLSMGQFEALDQRLRGSDPVHYYVYLHSLFFDGDLDFSNNLKEFYGPSFIPKWTSQGYQENVWSIGPAIFWFPFFLLAHLVTLISQQFTLQWAANGWSLPYIATLYIGNSLYGLLGCWFAYRFIATLLSQAAALFAALALLLASQMTFYVWADVLMSHNVSFAMAALFLWLWQKEGVGLLTGWAAAWMILARWQNAILLLPLAVEALKSLVEAGRTGRLLGWLRRHLLFGLILLAGVTPQMIVWQLLYGSPVTIPQGQEFLRFGDLYLWSILFSPNHGLFTWHPVLLVGWIGLLLYGRARPVLVGSLMGVLILQWILNAAVVDWWGGWSFGHRRFDSVLPLFGLGLGVIYERALAQGWRGRLLKGTAFLMVWNLLFIYQFKTGLIPRDKMAPTWRQIVLEKFLIPQIQQGQKEAIDAMINAQKGDMASFHSLARSAYEKAPDLMITLPLFAVSCVLQGEQLEGRVALVEWSGREPNSLLPRWGMAQLMIRNGEFAAAAELFPVTSTTSALESELAQRIVRRQPDLLDQRFIDIFNDTVINLVYIF